MNNDYGMMARAFAGRGQQQAGPYGGITAGQRPMGPMPGMAPRQGTTQAPGGIMPPHMQPPRPMQMGVPQQQNPISLAPGGLSRRPM